jgi:ribose transport system ATP-binding protein
MSAKSTSPAAPIPALEMKGLTKQFPGVLALDEIDLVLHAGEVHALAGENGAGKSSLIKVLCGIHAADSGQMTLNGAPFNPKSPIDAIRAGIRVVHQELHMLNQLSVAENLLFENLPRRGFGFIDRASLNRRAEELLALVGLEDLAPTSLVEGLGMAQRQLIEIAKALSNDSRVVVMDEPTATLTSREAKRLFEIINRLRVKGVAILFVSHHLQELFEIGDRVTVMRNGRKVATQAISDTTPKDLVRLMVGREVSGRVAKPAQTHSRQGKEALRVENLRFRGQAGSAGISFDVAYGEILGIAGLVGSGRTETVRAVFGADPLVSGNILRDGVQVQIKKPRDAMAHGICLVTEDRKDEGLVLDMSIRSNITMAQLSEFSRGGWLRQQAEADASLELVKQLDIRLASIEQPPRQLSGGNQQKVVLAKWLLRNPSVLILDEPTRGVDVGAKAEIHSLLQRKANDGMAIIAVSSDLPELMQLCDRIVVMSNGSVTGELPRDQFDEQRLLALAYHKYLKIEEKYAELA